MSNSMTQTTPTTPAPVTGLSIAGFVLAFVFSIAGLLISLKARADIDASDGALGGRGLATAGIWVSVISMVISFLWIVGS